MWELASDNVPHERTPTRVGHKWKATSCKTGLKATAMRKLPGNTFDQCAMEIEATCWNAICPLYGIKWWQWHRHRFVIHAAAIPLAVLHDAFKIGENMHALQSGNTGHHQSGNMDTFTRGNVACQPQDVVRQGRPWASWNSSMLGDRARSGLEPVGLASHLQGDGVCCCNLESWWVATLVVPSIVAMSRSIHDGKRRMTTCGRDSGWLARDSLEDGDKSSGEVVASAATCTSKSPAGEVGEL